MRIFDFFVTKMSKIVQEFHCILKVIVKTYYYILYSVAYCAELKKVSTYYSNIVYILNHRLNTFCIFKINDLNINIINKNNSETIIIVIGSYIFR